MSASSPIFLTVTEIVGLIQRDRMTVLAWAARGRFGNGRRNLNRKGFSYSLAAVEAACGKTFTPEQLKQAGVSVAVADRRAVSAENISEPLALNGENA